MARDKGDGHEAKGALEVKRLRRELRRVEDDLEVARRKRDRAQARVEALEALVTQARVALDAAKTAAVRPAPGDSQGTGVARPSAAGASQPGTLGARVRRGAPPAPSAGRRTRTRPTPTGSATPLASRSAKPSKPARPSRPVKPTDPVDPPPRRRRTRRAGGDAAV
jgi:hypothetical protein